MKKTNTLYQIILLAFFLFNYASIAAAQDFIWGLSGGSNRPTQGSDDETVIDMATDKSGNVYVLSQVMTPDFKIAGQPITGYGANDIMLASFRPDRTLRWVKMIGAGSSDDCSSLALDEKGGVYITGYVLKDNGPANIDKDATSPKGYQRFIIVKYDTAGRYQWHRHPEADTLSSPFTWNYNRSVAMDVDGSGNVYWLMILYPGSYGGGLLTVPKLEPYIVKYNASGGFSYIKPDLEMSGGLTAFSSLKIDASNNRFYLSGDYPQHPPGNLVMGGNQQPNGGFIGCFKLDGSFMWERHLAGTGEFHSRACLDASGNIYLVGRGKPSEVFNGYTITHGNGSSTPFIAKLDKNGSLLWAKDANVNASSGAFAIALRNKDEVVISGFYPGLLEWPDNPAIKFQSPANYGFDIFAARFSTQNGYLIDMDRIASNFGGREDVNRMVADGKGNVYIGGELEGTMYVCEGDTLRNSAGGNTDWFLIKYGDRFPVAVQDDPAAHHVNIYPNPATGQLVIDGVGEGTRVQLLNMLGQQMLKTISKADKDILDISSLIPGSYTLQLTRADGSRESHRVEKR